MKTFKSALTIALLSLTMVGCGDYASDPAETINVETMADAATPDAQPAEDPSAPDANVECRSLPKLGLICRGNVQCRVLPNVGLVCQGQASR